MLIASAVVTKALLDRLGAHLFAILLYRIFGPRRQDGIVPAHVYRVETVTGGNHLLMDFFTGAHADDRVLTLGTNGLGHIGDTVRGNLGHQYFAAPSMFQRPQHHVDTFLQTDVKTRHTWVCNRQCATRPFFKKEWNH